MLDLDDELMERYQKGDEGAFYAARAPASAATH